MTDKEKIRNEIERLMTELIQEKENGFGSDADDACILELQNVLTYIDSLQEEPVSIDFEQELYKAFGQVKDFTLGMNIAKWFYDMGKNNGKEPVSEELNEAAIDYAESVDYQGLSNAPWSFVQDIFKAGAIWQKEQFEKNRLEHCDSITEEQYNLEVGFIDQHLDKYNRMPTFLDAIEYGMKVQKEQMMANAIDVTVHIDAGGYPYTPEIELYDYDKDIPLAKEGDKYKIILIKEE